ncbi:hypothetical protein BC833DRAFT_626365 [Globomyces pollinis-pini]|nr:hypothetical protein BC833DRAFT_626365 [Globomyces pollinis-pini]
MSSIAKNQNNQLLEKLHKAEEFLCKDLYDRTELCNLTLLGLMSGQHIVFFGKPGLAKTKVADRLSRLVPQKLYTHSSIFKKQLSAFTTPEEIFGPRNISDMMDVLDEIDKTSSEVRNLFLQALEERQYLNGLEVEKMSLLLCVGTANSAKKVTNNGPLLDRFPLRYVISPEMDDKSFKDMLSKAEELIYILSRCLPLHSPWKRLNLSNLRKELKIKFGERNYISPRAWLNAVWALKVSAVCHECWNPEIVLQDLNILKHILWNNEDTKEEVCSVIEQVIGTSDTEPKRFWNPKTPKSAFKNISKHSEDIREFAVKEIFRPKRDGYKALVTQICERYLS